MATITFTLEEIIPHLTEILTDPNIKVAGTDGQTIHITVVKSVMGVSITFPIVLSFKQYNDPDLILNYQVEGKLGGKWIGQVLAHLVPDDLVNSNFSLEADTIKLTLNPLLEARHIPIRVTRLTQVEQTFQAEFHLVS